MAEFALKIGTAEARNHANEQKNAEQTYTNIVESLIAAKNQLKANWEGDSTDINDILTRIDAIATAFKTGINPCLNKLHNGVTTYADEVDKIGSQTVDKQNSGSSTSNTPAPKTEETKPTNTNSGNTNTDSNSNANNNSSSNGNSNNNNNGNGNSNSNNNGGGTTTTAPAPSNRGGKSMDIPSGNTSYKSYTSYKKVASNTPQGAVVYGGKASPYGKYAGTVYNTKTDPSTGVRYVTFEGDDTKYYCAAMGTYYGEVGDTFKVTTDAGNSYNVIMCDAKGSDAQGRHNGGTWYHSSGNNKCLTEFYIDSSKIPSSMKVYRNGDYIGTTGTYNSVPQFSGNITSITKLS